jgi:hypothetical protein
VVRKLLLLATIFRVVGGALGIANAHTSSGGLLQASDIKPSLTLLFLLVTIIGVLMRVNDGIWKKGFPSKITRALSLPLAAGIIVSNIEAAKSFNKGLPDRSSGYECLKVGVALFTAVFLTIVVIVAHSVSKISHVEQGNRRLFLSITLYIPFLIVRMAYKWACVWMEDLKWLSTRSSFVGAVGLQAVLAVLTEMSVVVFLHFASWTAPVLAAPTVAKDAKMVRTVSDATLPASRAISAGREPDDGSRLAEAEAPPAYGSTEGSRL